MKLLPKLRLSPRLARMIYPKLLRMGYHFVDLDAEGSSIDSRVFEYSFVISRLVKRQSGKVLDIGCTDSGNIVPLVLALLGWEVYGIDSREWKFEHPNFHFILGDIRNTPFSDNFFDYICAVSTLEHIGLKGRYRCTEEDPEGDIRAVMELARILCSGGTLLVTIPYGKGQLVKPLQRVYDRFRLQNLFSEWRLEDEVYYLCNDKGYLVPTSKEAAAQENYEQGGRAVALLEFTPLK